MWCACARLGSVARAHHARAVRVCMRGGDGKGGGYGSQARLQLLGQSVDIHGGVDLREVAHTLGAAAESERREGLRHISLPVGKKIAIRCEVVTRMGDWGSFRTRLGLVWFD